MITHFKTIGILTDLPMQKSETFNKRWPGFVAWGRPEKPKFEGYRPFHVGTGFAFLIRQSESFVTTKDLQGELFLKSLN